MFAYERDKVLQSVWRWMSNNQTGCLFMTTRRAKRISQYLPRVNTGHILITTRNKNWRNVQKIEVEVFQPQEAVEFFNSFKIEGSFNDANDLGKGLGYLPLALDQAAAYIIENNISYQEYLELYIKYQLEMFGESEFKPIFYEQTVATTWQISLAKIDNESAKQLIGLIAFLAPDNIQTDIFLQSSEYLPEPLASAVKHELKFKKTIKVLTQYSLIKSEKDRMSIHLLLQKVIRQSLKEEQARYFHACVNILYHLFTYNQYDAKTWENCAQLLPHVQSVLLCEQNGLKTETEEIAGLYANGGGWLLHTALYQKALEWNKKALSIREKVLGSDHLDTAMTCCNRAGIYYNLGEYKKALEWNKKGVEVFQKVYGPDNIVVATIYVNIASIYHSQGKYKRR